MASDEITRRQAEEGSTPTGTSKCTFSIGYVVVVKIRGEGGGRGYLPDDGGLVQRFNQWTLDEEVYSLNINGGYSGGGGYMGFYTPEDAEKVQAWLLENGVVNDDDKTWETR